MLQFERFISRGGGTSMLPKPMEAKSLRAHIMNIRSIFDCMNLKQNPREIWMGLVEVRPLEKNTILEEAKGAFVNIVTWASTSQEYKSNVELILAQLRLLLVDIVNPEPVQLRRAREGDFEETIEEMIDRAENNPEAIIYGTFHLWEKDDA